ncbi:MAG: LysM peptidoglycan-binding domain-containing protein, partial [Anaerolineae bacterium]
MVTYRSRDRRCPRCGTKVAQQARTCLLCGYRLDRGGYAAPLLALIAVAAISGVAIGILRDRSSEAQGTARTTGTRAATQVVMATGRASPSSVAPTPSRTRAATTAIAATATDTPTPEPTATETPVPPPTEAPTATATPGPIVHTVASGDTLLSIARQYGATVDDITAANSIGERTILSIGQQLLVPVPAGAEPASADTPAPEATLAPQFIVHVVEAGDTLLYLAGKYSTSVDSIVAANEGITSSTVLSIGQQVRVPVVAPVATTALADTATPEPSTAVDQTATPPVAGSATALAAVTTTATTSLMSMGGPAQPSALALLSPGVGAKVGANELILNWTGVGDLGPDLWYVVNVWTVGQYGTMIIG